MSRESHRTKPSSGTCLTVLVCVLCFAHATLALAAAPVGPPPPTTSGSQTLAAPATQSLTQQATTTGSQFWYYFAIALVCLGFITLTLIVVAMWRRRWQDIRQSIPSEPMDSGDAPVALAARVESHAPSSATLLEAQRLFTLMGDAEELATRLAAQLDEKSERLQRLIRTADERLARLDRATDAARVNDTSRDNHDWNAPVRRSSHDASEDHRFPSTRDPIGEDLLSTQTRQPTPAPTPTASLTPPAFSPEIVTRPVDLRSPAYAPANAPVPHFPGRRPLAQVEPQPMTAPQSPSKRHSINDFSQAPSSIDPLTAEIYRLADEGHPIVEIARHVGQHTGKVELILALRQG